MPRRISALAALLLSLPAMFWAASALAQQQEDLPWLRNGDPRYQPSDAYRPDTYRPNPGYNGGNSGGGYSDRGPAGGRPYDPRYAPSQPQEEAYRPPRGYTPYNGPGGAGGDYAQNPSGGGGAYQPNSGSRRFGEPYTPAEEQGYDRRYDPRPYEEPGNGYSSNEILNAGHGFFGSISKGMASVIEYAFQKQGRPNGYILGQDAGGAFVAGLRYGEGTLYTKDAGTHRIYWQGPSIGYDAGAEGSKVMVLVYNLTSPDEIFQRFGGVDGSAYLVGGVGLTFQKSGDIVVAPIRAGVGLRLGANVGYLKYTRKPTWNPF